VLVGHSSGAILATWAAATRPQFRAVVAVDAPIELGGNWLAKQLQTRAKRDSTPLRFAYFQARFPWPADAWAALESAAPSSWKLHKEILKHEGHETVFMLGTYLGLRESFADYSRLAAPTTPTTSVLPYYATVSAAFGDTLVPSKRIFRDVIDDLLMEGRGVEARNAYRAFVSAYGPPTDNADLVAQIAEVEKQPPPTETVESLLTTPAPTPDAARLYLGEWVGEVSRGPDAPRERNTLTVRVDSGRVVVELGNANGPPGMRVRRMDHVRVTKDGLTFGKLNGMRPRGVLLYEGVLRGDTLAGKTRWGGISFREPGGMGQTGFTFTRVKR
jgi:hypothetical protein